MDVWIVIPCWNNLYPLNIKAVSTILLTLSVSAIACILNNQSPSQNGFMYMPLLVPSHHSAAEWLPSKVACANTRHAWNITFATGRWQYIMSFDRDFIWVLDCTTISNMKNQLLMYILSTSTLWACINACGMLHYVHWRRLRYGASTATYWSELQLE